MSLKCSGIISTLAELPIIWLVEAFVAGEMKKDRKKKTKEKKGKRKWVKSHFQTGSPNPIRLNGCCHLNSLKSCNATFAKPTKIPFGSYF